MQVVVPSVSRAAAPHGRAATITVDTPSGPGLASPVGENCASSATPLTPFGAVGRASDGCWLFEASGDVPPLGAVPPSDPNGDGTPTPPPMTLPPVVVRSGRSAAHQTRRGATAHLTRRRSAANGGTAHACRTHSGAKCTTPAAATAGERKSNGQCSYQQRESQTSRIANDHGALLSVDPQIMWGACSVARWTSTESDRSSRISNRAASWRGIDDPIEMKEATN